MSASQAGVRQSVSLPSGVARRVHALAKRRHTSASRVIVELIEAGLDAREREKKEFFDLADRLIHSTNVAEQQRLKDELAQMTFGS